MANGKWLVPSLLRRLPRPIEMDLDLFQSSQAFFDLFVDQGQKAIEFLARVHNLDNDWQVLRQPFDLESMQTAVCAETHHPAHHCGSRKACFPRFEDDPFVQEPAVVAVALAD